MRSLVAGVNRPLGAQIAARLSQAGHTVWQTTRAELDLTDQRAVELAAERLDTAILTARLDTAAPAAAWLAGRGVARGVVFSSNNINIDRDDPVYARLREGEALLARAAPGWVILRPTMIYGHAEDGNTAPMMRRFAAWPAVPAPGRGRALQQPIYYEDLATLAAGCVSGAWDVTGAVSIGGPDTVTHREWLGMIRAASGARAPIVPLRFGLDHIAVAGLQLAGRSDVFSRAQLARVNLDKHVTQPPDIPASLQPATRLEDGLAALAAQLGFTPRYR